MTILNANNFLFKGKLDEQFYLSNNITDIKLNEKVFKKIINQDGDCPALFTYIYDKILYEITVLENVIIGISTQFNNNYKMKLLVEGYEGVIFKIKVKASLLKFTDFLNCNNYSWEIDKVNSSNKTFAVKINSLTTLMYSLEKGKEGFFQIASFDRALYDKLRNV